jgi:hypothetical protein
MMNKEFFDKLKGNMKTAKAVLVFCNEHRAEFTPSPDGYTVAVPRKLDPAVETELTKLLPDKPITFVESPKIRTRINLQNLINRTKPQKVEVSEPDQERRTVTISMEGIAEDDPVWDEMSDVLHKDGFFDSWKFNCDGQEREVVAKLIEVIAKDKATARQRTIGEDDITDLKISLGNAQTVDDILKAMGG